VEYLDGKMQTLPDPPSVIALGTGMFDWGEVVQEIYPPQSAAFARVEIGLFGGAVGIGMVDDVRVLSDAVDLQVAPYAASAYPGGPASDVDCAGCVGSQDIAPSAAFPAGFVGMFNGPCPAGWARLTQLDGKFPRGAATYGATGGGGSTAAVADHVHGVVAAGDHAHGGGTSAAGVHAHGTDKGGYTDLAGGTCCGYQGWWNSAAFVVDTMTDEVSGGSHAHNTTSAGNHSHSFTTGNAGTHAHSLAGAGTHAHDFTPPYLEIVFCVKK